MLGTITERSGKDQSPERRRKIIWPDARAQWPLSRRPDAGDERDETGDEDDERAELPPDVLKLTVEQRCICAMLLRGAGNRQIAIVLDLGLRTVELRRQQAAQSL